MEISLNIMEELIVGVFDIVCHTGAEMVFRIMAVLVPCVVGVSCGVVLEILGQMMVIVMVLGEVLVVMVSWGMEERSFDVMVRDISDPVIWVVLDAVSVMIVG